MTSTLDDARLASLSSNIQSKLAQLKHYRDHDCQLDHARTIAEGRIIQLEQVSHWVESAALVSPPSGREMLEAFQRIQGYSNNPGLVYTICSKMIDRLSPDQGTVAVASADRCAECGHPRADHSYNGACYGLCGKFVSTISSTNGNTP